MEDSTPKTQQDTDKLSQKLKDIEQSASNPYVIQKPKNNKAKLAFRKSQTSISQKSDDNFIGNLTKLDGFGNNKNSQKTASELWKETVKATTNVLSVLSLEWARLCEADGIFDDLGFADEDVLDDESQKDFNISNWKISKQNMDEFLEAIKLNERVSLTEMAEIIDRRTIDKKDSGNPKSLKNLFFDKTISFEVAVEELTTLLTQTKQISIQELLNHNNTTFDIPAERVNKFLSLLKGDLLSKKEDKNPLNEFYLREIEFARESIKNRSMFQSDTGKLLKRIKKQQCKMEKQKSKIVQGDHIDKDGRKRYSMKIFWMNEFSDIGSEVESNNTLKMVKASSTHLNYSAHQEQQFSAEVSDTSSSIGFQKLNRGLKRQKTTLVSLTKDLNKYQENLEQMKTLEFDILDLSRKIDRKQVLPFMVVHAINELHLDDIISNCQDELGSFLKRVTSTYKQDVQYHNDLHGADVMQMAYYMLTTGQLQKMLKLNKLDCLSFLMAAVCHDLGHDGFTNSYHTNAVTSRSIDSNDQSVQESFHAAEMFRILSKEKFNFLKNLSPQEFKIFRKRAIGFILGTDMAKHFDDISKLKLVLSDCGIENGENVEKLIESDQEKKVFDNQQFILEMSLHSCDVSQQTHNFKIAHEWTYLLFDEFFQQGDLEKEKNLPISMLCDRDSVNVAGSQPGFVNFMVVPLFVQMANVMPVMKTCVQNLKSNAERWSKYEETETDKQVYIKLGGNMEQIKEEQEDEKDSDKFKSFSSDEEDGDKNDVNDSKKKKLVKFETVEDNEIV